MRLSLIIPTFNRQAILCDTLKMAVGQDYPDYEIIVVDQTKQMSDELASLLQALGARVRYISQDIPNLPMARNVGIRHSTGDVIVFIDDDVIIERDYLSRHAHHYSSDSRIGGVVGLTWPARALNEDVALVAQSFACVMNKKLRMGEVASVKQINGGNTSFLRQAVLDAGLFDEDMGGSSWGEDTDLSVRVRKCGYTLLVDTRIILIHLEVPLGGCGNRNGDLARAVHHEHVELATYFRLKNWNADGLDAPLVALWRSYTAVALNRTTVRGGVWKLSEGHLEWLAILVRVSKRLLRLHRHGRYAVQR